VTDLRLLGPLEAPVELPGGKPRALLALLALHRGRVVASGALVDALWETPPPSAPKVLQAHVSALRKALGADAIQTRAPGYALRDLSTDLDRFEELTARAARSDDARERVKLLRDALALWRGEPLAEFRREPFAAPAGARLESLRLDAVTARVEAQLELGEHEHVVRELEDLVAADPLREEPRRQLMLALYRSGRQAEALAAYRDARRALVDALGIEPGPRLQELERAILRQDPKLESRPAVRGPIVCVGVAPVELLAPLGRELVVVHLVDDAAGLQRAPVAGARSAAFTSTDPVGDAIRLAVDQRAELLVVRDAPDALLERAPCDVAVANARTVPGAGPVLVPFGGGRGEWPALELAAWLAAAHARPLKLVGAEAAGGRRDASRTLAAASLALQRFGGVAAETALVAPGAAAILAEPAAAIVASFGRDATRRALLGGDVPVLLVHGSARPSALAPDRTLTRFSWSLAPVT
jgi:DNA-binding SARP family transcriptional activator